MACAIRFVASVLIETDSYARIEIGTQTTNGMMPTQMIINAILKPILRK